MDDFLEQVAVRKKQGLFNFLYCLDWAALIFCILWAALGLMGLIGTSEDGGLRVNTVALLTLLPFGALSALLWVVKDRLRVEYDYSFTNGTLDVSRVTNNRRRRYLTGLELSTVTRCGPAKGPSWRKALLEPNVKKHNWYVNRDAALTYFAFSKNGVKHLMLLELNDEMVKMVRGKNYLPKGSWYDAEGKSYTYGSIS